jgi:pimeloyl-ACP methyl ester carboxylesterase
MLEGSGTVILHDRVGTGRTPFREGGPDTLAKQADDLRRVIEAAGRGPAVILAQSFGGPVSVQLAVDHSEVVAGLVLLDISPFNDARIMGSMRHYRSMPRLFENRLVNPVYKAVVRRIIKSKLKSRKSTPALERAIEEMLDTAQLRSLAALTLDIAHQAARLHHRLISNPCSIKGVTVTADRKQGHSVRRAHEQIAQMTGTKFEMWEGTSHVLHLERPERVAAAVLQVLA